MNYNEIFEDTLSEICKKAPFSDDEQMFNTVIERASNMEKKKIKFKKPAVIAASIAAAAALTVSVGAAMNWDIASLFVQRLDTVKEQQTSIVSNIMDFYPEQLGEYRPENAVTDGGERNGYDILQKISQPLDETIEYNGYTVQIYGYAFDGTRFDVLYDITYSDEVKELIKENNRRLDEFGEMLKTDEELRKRTEAGDNSMNGYDGFINCPIMFSLYNGEDCLIVGGGSDSVTKTENGLECRSDLITDMSEGLEKAELVMEYVTKQEHKDLASFDVELSVPDDLILDVDTEYSKQLTDDRNLTVNNIRISPFGVNVYFTLDNLIDTHEDNSAIYQVPIYLIYKDGMVMDTSGFGNSTLMQFNNHGDGTAEPHTYLSSRGNVIDVTEIQAIKLYDTIINI